MGGQRLAHFFRRTPLPCGKIKSFSWFIILIDLEKRVIFRYITVTPRRLLTDSWHLIYCKKQVHICLEWLRSQNGQNLGNTLLTFSKDSLTFVSTVIIFKLQCVVRSAKNGIFTNYVCKTRENIARLCGMRKNGDCLAYEREVKRKKQTFI